MVQLANPFNAEDVEPLGTFEVMPEGWYRALISTQEQKCTKAAEAEGRNDEWFVNLTFDILEEQFKGQKAWTMLNLQNHSQKAMEIAYRELSSICHAVGRTVITDTSELNNIPLMIHLKMVPAVLNADQTVKYRAKNEVNGYKSLQDYQENNNTPAPAAQPQTSVATGGAANVKAPEAKPVSVPAKPPWEK